MILAFRRPCADHRDTLLDFVDRQERTPATVAALAHLDRCRRCESELAETALAITALRRLHREVAEVEPAPDSWLRLRARIQPPADPWRWRTTVGGLATSAMLVTVLVLPVTIGGPATLETGLGLPDSPHARLVESEYIATTRGGTLPPSPRAQPTAGSIPVNLPPEIAKVRKEVTSAPTAIARLPEPI